MLLISIFKQHSNVYPHLFESLEVKAHLAKFSNDEKDEGYCRSYNIDNSVVLSRPQSRGGGGVAHIPSPK